MARAATIIDVEPQDDTSERLQLLLIRLGNDDSAEAVTDWTDTMRFSAPTIEANGTTPPGAAVRLAMHKLEEQKAGCVRPA